MTSRSIFRSSGLGIVIGLAVLAAASCSSTRPIPAPGMSQTDIRSEMTGPIMDPSLDGSIEVGTTKSRRLASGNLEVTVPIRNVTDEPLEVRIQVTFLDENGYDIPYDQTPRTTLVLPRGPYSYRVTSFKTQAARFRVYIDRSAP